MKGIIISALAIGIGFTIVKIATSKKVVVGGDSYRASVYLGEDGQWFAQVFKNGKPEGATLGPFPYDNDAAEQAAAYLQGLDVAHFYTLHSVELAPGKWDWYFDGWTRGTKIADAQGPFASEAIANTAGTNWVAKQGAQQ
jgi:hypothetical protein